MGFFDTKTDHDRGIEAGKNIIQTGGSEISGHLSTWWNPMDSENFSKGVDEGMKQELEKKK